jgi:alkanesulfonate monooxygenase SsuD/methylene tetrahydromethanopterin reductase-like flavin-dependent oxidoreductase (luciferase family)
MGAGYLPIDYQEYGYELGTAKSRMQAFIRDIPIIKARLAKLNPPPLRKMPLLIAAMGEGMGLPLAAEHADIWHVYGELEKVEHKLEVFREMCGEFGRDPAAIEVQVSYFPGLAQNGDPDAFYKLGFDEIIVTSFGPDWDLGGLREMLQWRARLPQA